MTGHFRVAESEAALKERLAAAIEHAVEPMNFIARPIARSRLQSAVYYCKQYEMALGPRPCASRATIARRSTRRLDNSEGPGRGTPARSRST